MTCDVGASSSSGVDAPPEPSVELIQPAVTQPTKEVTA